MNIRAYPISRARAGVDFHPVLGRVYSYKRMRFSIEQDRILSRGFHIDFGNFTKWICAPWWRDPAADVKLALFYALELIDALIFGDTGEAEKATSRSYQCQERKHLILSTLALQYPVFLVRAETTTGSEFTFERGLGHDRGVFGFIEYHGDQILIRGYYWTPDTMEMVADISFAAANMRTMLPLVDMCWT